jgi:hypothetical protein
MGNDRSREKLSRDMEEEVIKMFEQILDYSQVACTTTDTFKVLRSKILRAGNNCIRNLKGVFKQYDVGYISKAEDIIEFK